MINYDEVRKYHLQKRCSELADLYRNRNELSFLNTALLDDDSGKTAAIKDVLEAEGFRYRLYDAADQIKNKSRLRIVYLIPHSNITGGLKILIEQSNRLAVLGHEVLLYSHCPKPQWIECRNPYFVVNPENNLSDVVPPVDVVIAGYWDLVVDALRVKAPLKYHFAQGDYDIFDYERLDRNIQNIIGTAYTLPVKIITVSGIMQKRILELFGRKSVIIPNALDRKVFHSKNTANRENGVLQVLLVGSDGILFKGHVIILSALYQLKKAGYPFQIHWITQTKLQYNYEDLGFGIKEYVAPTQKEIGDIYRSSDLYICGSYYESFALPPLEAMACGAAVITSDNGGIGEYAKDAYNSLIYKAGNAEQLKEKLELAFNHPELRAKLRENGFITAKNFSWNKSIQRLQKELVHSTQSIVQAKPLVRQV